MPQQKRVYFAPRFGAQEVGGVAVHVRTLARHLTQRGWEIATENDGSALVHCHAMGRAENIDVATCHGIYPIKPTMPRWQQDANAQIFDNLKLAREIIAVSQWTAAQWQDLIGRKPHIIYNGVNPSEWVNIPQGRWRAKLEVPPQTPLVLWGKNSLSDVLDPTPLIELALRYPQYRFVAPLPNKALYTAPKNLTCVGAQSFTAMQMLLQDCDVYLATVQENHSIQILEAMLLQKPILGYAWGGTAETVTTGGLLVAPHDLAALTAALPEVYAQRAAFGADGSKHVVKNFNIKTQIDQLEEVYAMAGAKRGSNSFQPKCSIIIPVYNKAQYVGETIKSALHQGINAPRYEVIIVNDGSTDDSLTVARREVGNFNGITGSGRKAYIYDLPNGGVSAARNFGISKARGEYICCLDADDLIDIHFLERMSAALDADPGLGIAYSDFLAFGTNEAGERVEAPITCNEYDFEKLKRGNMLPCCNLFRKVAWERAGGYKPINPSWEDYELWLNMGKLGWYGKRVPGMLFKYRKVPKLGRDYESQGHEWRLRGTVNKYHRDLYPPLISVIIPCYKQSQFLRDAIESVRVQTMPDWEIVVVDDGNELDEAREIVSVVGAYEDRDIRSVRLVQNSKLATARNMGIEQARGTWIVPLDADDKLAPTFLEKALKATNLDPQRFAYTDAYLWWPETATGEKLQELQAHDYDFDEMLIRVTWACTIMYHRQAWQQAGGYKPQMSEAGGWEDWEFVIQLGRDGVCGQRVAEPLFYYRQHSSEQMRYNAEARKPELQEELRRIHADLYRGERPMACCGGGKRRAATQTTAAPVQETRSLPAARAVSASSNSNVLIRYTGPREGSQTWRSPSNRTYRFSRSEPLQQVAAVDVDWILQYSNFQRVTA